LTSFRLQPRYTRSDPKGHFPRLVGVPEVEHNRIGVFWRPLIDMTDSDVAALMLRLIQPVASWIADPSSERWSWFAMLGVPGLRHQVIRHGGLDRYDSPEPGDLAPELRTEAWSTLVDSIERFPRLDACVRALVVFELAQLSYGQFVVKLTELVEPTGDPAHDRYAYEVARVHVRYPGRGLVALPMFRRLADTVLDPVLALLSCFQGISHSIRVSNDLALAHSFEERARALMSAPTYPDTWHGTLIRSRLHRALALVRMIERNLPEMRRELHNAVDIDAELPASAADEFDRLVALENRRILVEAQIKAAARDHEYRTMVDVAELCEELAAIDPYCVEASLVLGDGYSAIGEYETAATWYSRAGELCTGAGAIGWFRAAQCFDFIGDRWSAVNAMGHCLELDTTAIEPRDYLKALKRPVLDVAA
jgi:hypothetical protein